jgi:hypothetical protein
MRHSSIFPGSCCGTPTMIVPMQLYNLLLQEHEEKKRGVVSGKLWELWQFEWKIGVARIIIAIIATVASGTNVTNGDQPSACVYHSWWGLLGFEAQYLNLFGYEISTFSIVAKVSSRCKLLPFTCTHHPILTSFCFKPSSAFHHLDNLAKPFDPQLNTNIHKQRPIANWRCFL